MIGQGLPVPRNRECIERMSAAIRASDAVPAWIGVVDGSVTVGLSDAQLARFTEPGAATKVARRDYPLAVASGELGATTVSATIWAAAKAGIVVSATGGIGGVHPGDDPDVSADLFELARTPGLLVCSGPKSIIDPAATAEKLEELGVALVGYGVDRLPFFLAREAPVDLEHRVDTPAEAAAVARAVMDLRSPSTVLLCNPIPEAHAMDPDEVAAAVDRGRSSCRARRRARQGADAVPPGRARRAHGWTEPRGEPRPAGGQRAGRRTRRDRAWPRSAQPGLDDDLGEVPAVLERLRLLRLAAGAREDRDRHLDDARVVAERLDQDLARPELILLQDERPQQVGARRTVAARDVGDARARQDRDEPLKKCTPRWRIVLSFSK